MITQPRARLLPPFSCFDQVREAVRHDVQRSAVHGDDL